VGALCRVSGRDGESRFGPNGDFAIAALRQAVRNTQPPLDVAVWRETRGSVEGFNDSEGTTHEDVLTVIDLAIEIADATQRTPAA